MEIPSSLIEELKLTINQTFKPIFEKHLSTSKYSSFDVFINDLFNEILDELENLIEVTNDIAYTYTRRRLMTKKRWSSKELKSDGGFYKEIEVVAKSLFEDTLNQNQVKFFDIYGYNTYQELRDGTIKDLQEWASEHDRHISDFIYLKYKSENQIITGMINDIRYLVYNEILQKSPKGKQSAISSLPLSLSQLPIDYTSKARLNENDVEVIGQDKYFMNKYQIDDDTILESRLNVEILKTGVLDSVLKTLNTTDISVFLYCMSLRDDSFYNTREIIVDIGDIVKNVFASDNTKNYMSVKECLYRMQYLNSGVVDKSLRGFTVKILDNVEIFSNKGRETAKITVNIDIVNEYIKEQTVSTYRDVINKFKLGSSKVAIFRIQMERIKVATSTDGGELILNTNYNFFRGILYLSSKRKRDNIKTIEKMLDEIKANNIALKDYERKGDNFILKFYPISEQERRDLLNPQDVKDLLKVNKEQLQLSF